MKFALQLAFLLAVPQFLYSQRNPNSSPTFSPLGRQLVRQATKAGMQNVIGAEPGQSTNTISTGTRTNLHGATYWIGFEQPPNTTTWTTGGAGNIFNDTVAYRVTFYGPDGESFASKATAQSALDGENAALSNIPTSSSSRVTGRKIYRATQANPYQFKLVGTLADNTTTTFEDDVAEEGLGDMLSTSATDGPYLFEDENSWFNWKRYHVFEFSDSETEGFRYAMLAPSGKQLFELRGDAYTVSPNGIFYIGHPADFDAISLQVSDGSEDALASDPRITFHFGTNTGKAYRLRANSLRWGTSDQMQIFNTLDGKMTFGGTNGTVLQGSNVVVPLFGFNTAQEGNTVRIGSATNYVKVHTNRVEIGGPMTTTGIAAAGPISTQAGVISLKNTAQQITADSDLSSVSIKAGSAVVAEFGNYDVEDVAQNFGLQLLVGSYKGNGAGLTNLTDAILTQSTPASASAPGTKGQVSFDGSYLYICVAANTWRRIAHNTW